MDADKLDAASRPMPLRAELIYDPRSPFAVTLVLLETDVIVEWTFGRELLATGARSTVEKGLGAVRIGGHPDAGCLQITLMEVHDRTVITMPRGTALSFLRQSERLVPYGMENDQIDWEGMLARLSQPG